jgi:hypothetical protein
MHAHTSQNVRRNSKRENTRFLQSLSPFIFFVAKKEKTEGKLGEKEKERERERESGKFCICI